MAGSTTNLGLIKPLGSEKIRIAQINQNSDTLDAAIGAVGSTSLQAQVSAVEDGLAIVANGDSHVAITAGQFVYVRNNTHNLAEGLYVASANVSANASITSSNMTADASGGLNALNNKINTVSSKLSMDLGDISGNDETALIAAIGAKINSIYSLSSASVGQSFIGRLTWVGITYGSFIAVKNTTTHAVIQFESPNKLIIGRITISTLVADNVIDVIGAPYTATKNTNYIGYNNLKVLIAGKLVNVSGRFEVTKEKPAGQDNYLFSGLPEPAGGIAAVETDTADKMRLIINGSGYLTANDVVTARYIDISATYSRE